MKGNAGYDLHAISYEWNPSACCWIVSTGISLEIPEGYVGIIKDRSGQAKVSVEIHAGVIDSSYRGELLVLISARSYVYDAIGSILEWLKENANPFIEKYSVMESIVSWIESKTFFRLKEDKREYAFKKPLGKFAQIVIVPYLDLPLEEVIELSETERGDKGFGSTGI